MALLLSSVILCIADYLYFKIRYTRPDGPPVWYLLPFVGVMPFYCLPKSLFLPIITWFFKNAPNVIITRFCLHPCVIVKNEAIEDAQGQEKILSRSAQSGLAKTLGYMMSGRPWHLMDGGLREIPWKAIRKTNIMALNILPRQQKFQRTADAVDHFLQKIENQNGRLYHYEDDLCFSKVQETSNLNLGRTFECNNLQSFVETVRMLKNSYPLLTLICVVVPLPILLMIERLLPKRFRPSAARRVYSKIVNRFVEDKLNDTDEPKDFFGAVLRLRKADDAIDFFKETTLLNVLATTHTTMHSTIATLSYIALDDRIQAKLHKELDQVVGSAPLSYEHLNQLHYLKATIHEANRMNPPLPKILRLTTDTVKVAGYTLPSNMMLLLYLVSETVDPKHFPNPDRFMPERFMTEKGEFAGSKHFSVFSRGKRRCSRIEIANLSQQVHLAKILQHFKLIAEDPQATVPRYSGSVLPETPIIPMRFVCREKAPLIRPPHLDTGLSAMIQEIIDEES